MCPPLAAVSKITHFHVKHFGVPQERNWIRTTVSSDGYSVRDINYVFPIGQKSVTAANIEMPQFVLNTVKISNITEKLSSGSFTRYFYLPPKNSGVYSRLVCFFLFNRNIGFYLLQVYLPSVLIVSISWVSFWLSREATVGCRI